MDHMRPGVKVRLWTGGFTSHASIDPPWLLKLVAVLAILSMVGTLVYMVAIMLSSGSGDGLANEAAIYIAVLHFLLPITVLYTVTTNAPISRFLILVYFITLYVATVLGKGFLGGLDVDESLRLIVASFMLFAIVLWLFAGPKMRFYYAMISGKPIPEDLESRAATFMDDSKLNPKTRAAIDWVADHVETIALLAMIAVTVYACLLM